MLSSVQERLVLLAAEIKHLEWANSTCLIRLAFAGRLVPVNVSTFEEVKKVYAVTSPYGTE
jgi:hypothetical protein